MPWDRRPKPWPFKPHLLPGELLTSLLIRTAHCHGQSAFRFFKLYWPNTELWNRDWDRCVSVQWLEDMSQRSNIPFMTLEAASLRPWMRQCGLSTAHSGTIPFVLSCGIHAFNRRRHGLSYCPACLADAPHYYRAEWRFSTALWCEQHQIVLRDACPQCDAPIAPHRHPVLKLSRCHRCTESLTRGDVQHANPDQTLQRLHRFMFNIFTRASQQPETSALGADISFLRSVIGYLSTHDHLDRARAVLGLAARPRRLQEEPALLENLRLPHRYEVLEAAAHILAQCPRAFVPLCAQLKITQVALARWAIPDWLKPWVPAVKQGHHRQRHVHHQINTPALRLTRRRSKSAYRRQRAVRMARLLRRSFHE